jgi:predicted AAA+ superfamily ATPase
LYLKKQESLAGRMQEIQIKPLNFWEFLRFKEKDYILQEKNIYKDEIVREFEKYIFRQFIDIIDSSDDERLLYINSLINKIVKEDIAFYFRIEFPDLLIKIFKIIASNPWIILDYKNFSNDLDIDQRTLEKYIYYLKEAFLIKKVYNYSKNLIKTERKLKKVYLQTTSFSSSLLINWEIFENYVLNTLDLEYFYRFSNIEVDFIGVENKNSLTPNLIWYEIKYKDKIKKQDTKWLMHFDKKYNLKEKLIVSKSFNGELNWVQIIDFTKIWTNVSKLFS